MGARLWEGEVAVADFKYVGIVVAEEVDAVEEVAGVGYDAYDLAPVGCAELAVASMRCERGRYGRCRFLLSSSAPSQAPILSPPPPPTRTGCRQSIGSALRERHACAGTAAQCCYLTSCSLEVQLRYR